METTARRILVNLSMTIATYSFCCFFSFVFDDDDPKETGPTFILVFVL